MAKKIISESAKNKKIDYRLYKKNKTLIRRNEQLRKLIQNRIFIFSVDKFALAKVDELKIHNLNNR